MIMKKIIGLLILLPMVFQVQAQAVRCGVSPKGVVLHYEGPMPQEKIELFRNGTAVGTIKLNKGGLSGKLEEAETFWEVYPHVQDSLVPKIEASIQKSENTETIYLGYYLTVRQACGLAVVDAGGHATDTYTAKAGEREITTVWDRRDSTFMEPALSPLKYQSYLSDIETGWLVNPDNRLYFARIYRRNTDSAYYRLVPDAKYRYSNLGDSLLVIAADTSLPYLSYFSYIAVGYDFYTNPSARSAPLMADNLDGSTRPVLLGFTAKEENGQVDLKWKVKNSSRVKSILLFRSSYSDSAFALITQLSPADTIYRDISVNPMEPVYYRLVLYDLKGLITDAPVIPMVSHEKPDVLPPAMVSISLMEDQPMIKWSECDPGARGFYVYRTDVVGREPAKVSGFIPKGEEPYTWIDTTSWLKPGRSYHYSVVAESRGYVPSDYSSFVSADIPDHTPPAVPVGVVARKMEDGSALIVWNTHGRQAGDPMAFFVYRSSTEEGPFVQLNEEPVFGENSFTDHPGMANDTVYYTVTSLSPDGKESPQSVPVRVLLRSPDWGVRYILGKRSGDAIIISWPVGEPGLAGFELYRSEDRKDPVMLTRLPAETGTFTDKDLAKGKIYAYRLVSIDANGKKSQPSEWVVMEP